MRLLCFDPSGNWSEKEGKGTSGWSLFVDGELKDFGDISAEDFTQIEGYWAKHYEVIYRLSPDIVVIESYKLQPGKAMQQSWSQLETPQLIGYLRMKCWDTGIKYYFQDPSIKTRFNDEVLADTGVIVPKEKPQGGRTGNGQRYYCLGRMTNLHERDAIRHGLYFLRYGAKGSK